MGQHIVCMIPLLLGGAGQPLIEDYGKELATIDRVEQALPVVVVRQDDVRINRSCVIRIPPGTVIADDEGDGVIQIVASNVTVLFEPGSQLQGRAGIDDWLLRGTRAGEGWDTLTGTGITINGHSNVEIINADIRGYRNGIIATNAPRLVITDATLTDMYRQRLTSTATREGSSDWLYPHNNDENEWLSNYGAAIWAERCHEAKITGVKVRRGQNGIVLDNTNSATVSKNDCSFLSGWGLAMWRASQNEIAENRFDFCVRGHVEGVYNRGQDSAGILMFEACRENTITSNSCTHSGDGIFGFGGNDAVSTTTTGAWGNAGNLFRSNDLSFAPAHGLEMTFSEHNTIVSNLFESNAICGIWGGYSQGFSISSNVFRTNGGMAYGAERGAINIEHGSRHEIRINRFINNKCAVRLWWDFDESLLAQPGVMLRYQGVEGNAVKNNWFTMNSDHPFGPSAELLGIELQDIGEAPGYTGMRVGVNEIDLDNNQWTIENPDAVQARLLGEEFRMQDPDWPAGNWRFGGLPKRISPPGREWIIVDQWGPWDFESPTLREHSRTGSADIFELYPPVGSTPRISIDIQGVNAEITPPESDEGWSPWHLTISPRGDEPVSSYSGTVRIGDGWSRTIAGRFINTTWNVKCWAWENDPLVDLEAWRAEAESVQVTAIDQLDLPFGYNGPARVNHALTVSDRDTFSIIAQSEIELPRGKWKISTLSDDGIRVFINGVMRLERWDIHGPTPDEVVFEVHDDSPTRIELEYFENNGYATLQLDLQPVN